MAYKFQLGDAKLSGSVTSTGVVDAEGALSGALIQVDDTTGIAGNGLDNSSGKLTIDIAGSTGIAVDANGISLSGVPNSSLENSGVTLTQGAGMAAMGSVSLGGSVTVAVDGNLEDLDTLGVVDAADKFIVSTGAGAFGYETADTVRTTLGLGTAALLAAGTGSTNLLQASASIADDDFLRINGSLVEGLSDSEMRSALGLVIGTNVQAFDAELAAIAGLSSAANKGIQFTGAGTAGTYDLTAAGKALLDDADAAAQRTTMGVAIGSDVQAYDADLDTLSGMQSGAAAALAVLNSTEIAILDGATASTAEVNFLAGASTANDTASKAVIIDSNGDVVLPGELRVTGDLVYVNTTNLKVSDALVTFASGTSTFGTGRGFEIGEGSANEGNFKTATATLGGSSVNHFASSLAVSSSAFYGDGSGLTNIQASDAVLSVFDIADNATPQNIGGAGFHLWSGGSDDRIVHLSGTGGWVDGEVVYIKNTNASNKLTIAPSGTNSIDGTNGQTIALETQGAAVTLIRKGPGWMIV